MSDNLTLQEALSPNSSSDDAPDLITKVKGYFRECKDFYGEGNIRKAKDYDYYEGDQTWTAAEEHRRDAEGKPTIRLNQINGVVDLAEGLERQTRLDVIIKGRNEKDMRLADALTQSIKYVADQNNLDYKFSKAFSHAIKGGVGWLIPVRNPDPLQEEIMIEVEGPFRVWLDPNCEKEDLTDAKYLLYLKWVDIGIAKAWFPEHADELESMMRDRREFEDSQVLGISQPWYHGTDYHDVPEFEMGDYMDIHRSQVLIVECWRYQYEKVSVLAHADGRKEELHSNAIDGKGNINFDFLTQDQQVAMSVQGGSIVTGYTNKPYVTMFCGDVLLYDDRSPYKHNRFPFIPIWAYRRRTGETYGIIRNLIGAQDEVNIHASQATHILNTVRVFVKKTAPMKRAQVAEEAARPDPIFEITGPDDIKIERDVEALKDHMIMMQGSKDEIQRASGINDELLGMPSDAKSGVAIRERQKQGTMRITSIFDYARYAKQMMAEQVISLIAQYWSPQKLVQITQEMSFLQQQSATFKPMQQQQPVESPLDPDEIDIENARYKVVIEEQSQFGTFREQQLQMLQDMIQSLPMIAQFIAPDIIRASDLPDKEILAQKVEMLSGQAMQMQQQQEMMQAQAAAAAGQQQPPQPHESILASMKLTDLGWDQQQEFIQKYLGIQPSQMHPAVDAAYRQGKTTPEDPQAQAQAKIQMQRESHALKMQHQAESQHMKLQQQAHNQAAQAAAAQQQGGLMGGPPSPEQSTAPGGPPASPNPYQP